MSAQSEVKIDITKPIIEQNHVNVPATFRCANCCQTRPYFEQRRSYLSHKVKVTGAVALVEQVKAGDAVCRQCYAEITKGFTLRVEG